MQSAVIRGHFAEWDTAVPHDISMCQPATVGNPGDTNTSCSNACCFTASYFDGQVKTVCKAFVLKPVSTPMKMETEAFCLVQTS